MQKNVYMQACITSTKEIYGVLSGILHSKVLIYTAMQVIESNKGVKVLQACIKT